MMAIIARAIIYFKVYRDSYIYSSFLLVLNNTHCQHFQII